MIHRAELERLERQNHTASYNQAPTPSAVTVQQVNWQLEKMRRENAKRLEQEQMRSGETMHNNFALKSTEGLAKAQFNSKTQNPSMG